MLTKALGLIYRAIEGHLIKQAALTRRSAQSGAVRLIQRFGSAPSLNVHLHMLFLDGVYECRDPAGVVLHQVRAPSAKQLQTLLVRISGRVGAHQGKKAFTLQSLPASPVSALIACIEDPAVIARILQHLETHPPRGPPAAEPLQAG